MPGSKFIVHFNLIPVSSLIFQALAEVKGLPLTRMADCQGARVDDYPKLSRPFESMKSEYDVVVVGSGYGAGVAASRMARAGKTVAVLELGWERRRKLTFILSFVVFILGLKMRSYLARLEIITLTSS